jgi:hypothetical protein
MCIEKATKSFSLCHFLKTTHVEQHLKSRSRRSRSYIWIRLLAAPAGSATLVDGNGPGTHQSGIIINILSNIEHQVTYVVTLIGLPASPDSDVGASFSATCATT